MTGKTKSNMNYVPCYHTIDHIEKYINYLISHRNAFFILKILHVSTGSSMKLTKLHNSLATPGLGLQIVKIYNLNNPVQPLITGQSNI